MHSIILVMIFCFLGCAPHQTKLGDSTYRGKLPKGWENAAIHENDVIRIIRLWIPLPWEIRIYPIQSSADSKTDGIWRYIKTEKINGPKIRVGQNWRQTKRRVWIYRKQFDSNTRLEASVDYRFDQEKAEEFLDSIQKVNP